MFVKIVFGASIVLAGLFLALPEMLSPVINWGSAPFTFGRLVGIVAVVFEGWWIIRKLQSKKPEELSTIS